jgi:hypothetical protein
MRTLLLSMVLFSACVVVPAKRTQPVVVNTGGSGEAEPISAEGGDAEVTCDGNDHREIVGQTITAANVAIDVHGNCSVTIKGSTISSDNIAIQVHGNGAVELDGCTVNGKNGAVVIHGNAVVTAHGSTFIGGLKKHGNATLEDGGGNAWR